MKATLPVVLFLLSFLPLTQAQESPEQAEFDRQWKTSLAAAEKFYPELKDPNSALSRKATEIQDRYANAPEKATVYYHPSSAMLFAEMAAEALKDEKRLLTAQRLMELEAKLADAETEKKELAEKASHQLAAFAAEKKELEEKVAHLEMVAKNLKQHSDNLVASTPTWQEIAKVKAERDEWKSKAIEAQRVSHVNYEAARKWDETAKQWRVIAQQQRDQLATVQTQTVPSNSNGAPFTPLEIEIRGNNAFGSDGSMLRKRVDSAGNIHYE